MLYTVLGILLMILVGPHVVVLLFVLSLVGMTAMAFSGVRPPAIP